MLNNSYYVLKIFDIEGKKKLIYYNASISSLAKVYREILDKCFNPNVIYNQLKNIGDFLQFMLSYDNRAPFSFLVEIQRKEYR